MGLLLPKPRCSPSQLQNDLRSVKVIVDRLHATAMISFLLLSLLLIDAMESQTTRGTFEGNQTFNFQSNLQSAPPGGTVEPNVRFTLTKEERKEMDEELMNNQTSNLITEENESFQDPKIQFSFKACNRQELVQAIHTYCGAVFHNEMSSVSSENWCLLQHFIRAYDVMTRCLDIMSQEFSCFYPNPDTQDFFLYVHSLYFHNCSREEVHLEDAPKGLVVTLTLIPISLIPLLLYLMVWKLSVASTTTDLHS